VQRLSTCIPNLTHNNPHKNIEQISEGIILLNDFNGTVINHCNNNETRMLQGTYLLKFNNCSIEIEGQLFISREVHLEISLKKLNELHINNIDKIETLEAKSNFTIVNNKIITCIAAFL
jgi:hypothetical protein